MNRHTDTSRSSSGCREPRVIGLIRNGRHHAANVRSAIIGCVLAILWSFVAYRVLRSVPAALEPVNAPALPRIEFRETVPVEERMDSRASA